MTEARLGTVDFVAPDKQRPVRELIVTGPKAPAIASMDDLAGKTVHVRPSSRRMLFTAAHDSVSVPSTVLP